MKKLSLLFILAIIAFSVKAQEDFLIPTIGGNFSGMVFGKNDQGYGKHSMMKGGFIGGIRYQHQFKKPFLVETALLYNESGFILKDVDEIEYYKEFLEYPLDKINNKFNYLSVPLMFGYRFGRADRKFSIAPKIGVQFGYLTSSKMKYVYNGEQIKRAFETGNKFDFAEVLEVEFSWVWGKRVRSFLSIAQRYSFTNLNSGDDELQSKDVAMHNHQISANIGLRIKLNKMEKSFFD